MGRSALRPRNSSMLKENLQPSDMSTCNVMLARSGPVPPPLQQTATKQALPVILIEPETLGFTQWLIFFSLSLIFLKITVLPLVSELLNVTSLSSCLTFISIVIDLQHKANCFLYLDLLKRTGWHHHQLINTFTQRYAGYHHLIPLCQLFSHHFTL